MQRPRRPELRHPWAYLRRLGPGVVAGAADNDPTTVATISVSGATTGFGLSWLVILIYPMLAAAQIVAAQVGLVTGKGMQQLVKERYGVRWGTVLLVSVLAVNLITLAADLEAGAAAISIVVPLDFRWFVVPYAVILALVLVVGAYDQVERILKYAVLVFVAYVGAAFLAHPHWGEVADATFRPHISLSGQAVQAMLALLGTTLTSYAYFWEAQEEAEEGEPIRRLGLAKVDAGLGILLAVAIFWFTLVAVGATLGPQHKDIQTAQDAAAALRPIAGPAAAYLFAIGLLASSFVAVPILAATSGYLIANELGRLAGLSRSLRAAPTFYVSLLMAMLIGVGVSLAGISAIQLLFIASIVGGIGTPVSLAFLLRLAQDRQVMGDHRVGRVPRYIGWGTVALTAVISAYFLWDQLIAKALHIGS